MNTLNDALRSIMNTSNEVVVSRPNANQSKFVLSPNAGDEQYPNLIDTTTIKFGADHISDDDDAMDDLIDAMCYYLVKHNIDTDNIDIQSKVLVTKFAFEVSYKHEGIGYVVVE